MRFGQAIKHQHENKPAVHAANLKTAGAYDAPGMIALLKQALWGCDPWTLLQAPFKAMLAALA